MSSLGRPAVCPFERCGARWDEVSPEGIRCAKGHRFPRSANGAVELPAGLVNGHAATPVSRAAAARRRRNGAVPPVGEAPTVGTQLLDPTELTDVGNARLLAREHGAELRYCSTWKAWLAFDGRRWQQDDSGEVWRRAKATVRTLYSRAAAEAGDQVAARIAAWALRSHRAERLRAMVMLAQSEPGIPITPAELDRDPWQLNVANGTLDLRTSELGVHRREDYITRLSPLEYDPDAACERWLAFLERVQPSADVRAFLQRALGYSATGSARERALIVCWGSGRNGKGTLLQAVKTLLGDYAVRTPSETFAGRRDDAIPNDLAALRGARFVFASETKEGRRLAEATLKDLTGGEEISARFMRGEFFSFTPTFTPWLATNHRPRISGTDPAIWDRIRLVPFTVRIPDDEQDPELVDKLQAEAPGILTWIVRGAQSWYASGLGLPDAVQQATQGYRADEDLIGDFLADCCVTDEQAWVSAAALYARYVSWCESSGEKPLSKKGLGLRLAERGLTACRIGKRQERSWSGVRLLAEGETPATPTAGQTRPTGQTHIDTVLGIDHSGFPRIATNRESASNASDDPHASAFERRCSECGEPVGEVSRTACAPCQARLDQQFDEDYPL